MVLYLLKAIPSGRIKIGISDDFPKRLSQIRRGNSEEVEVLKAFSDHDGDYIRQLEKDIHEELAGVRFQWEWFEDGPEARLVIDRLTRQFTPENFAVQESTQ
jgi:uncharacterized protein (DUF2249 family)